MSATLTTHPHPGLHRPSPAAMPARLPVHPATNRYGESTHPVNVPPKPATFVLDTDDAAKVIAACEAAGLGDIAAYMRVKVARVTASAA